MSTVKGKIVSKLERPLSGIDLEIATDDAPEDPFNTGIKSDKAGAFEANINGFVGQTLRITAKLGETQNFKSFKINDPTQEIDLKKISLNIEKCIVKVLDRSGNALPRATVKIIDSPGNGISDSDVVEKTTDDQGCAELCIPGIYAEKNSLIAIVASDQSLAERFSFDPKNETTTLRLKDDLGDLIKKILKYSLFLIIALLVFLWLFKACTKTKSPTKPALMIGTNVLTFDSFAKALELTPGQRSPAENIYNEMILEHDNWANATNSTPGEQKTMANQSNTRTYGSFKGISLSPEQLVTLTNFLSTQLNNPQ